MDCGRRYAAALLRRARVINKNYKAGDWVMYKIENRGDVAPGDQWHGPARMIGADDETVWIQHGSVPVATSYHLMRPANAEELLAAHVLSRHGTPTVDISSMRNTEDQLAATDARDRTEDQPQPGVITHPFRPSTTAAVEEAS